MPMHPTKTPTSHTHQPKQEAEGLCDRLGIFVNGALRCIGNPTELTSRFGGYYILTITCAHGQESRVAEMVHDMATSARVTCELPIFDRFVCFACVHIFLYERESSEGAAWTSVCMCVYVRMCVYMYVWMHVCTYLCQHVCMIIPNKAPSLGQQGAQTSIQQIP